ncbi:MAG: ComEC/Rec2 family competence protein [Lachnospiraceae bacterium]|nr:ComEC/Rec2 family competence protein [Lachnospiraceae bacterium]
MRRPLAFICAVIVVSVFIGNLMGILPFEKTKPLPEEGAYITLSGIADEIYDNYIIVSDAYIDDAMPGLKLLVRFNAMPDLHIGEGVVIGGEYASFKPAMNPGEFNAYEYYTSKGYDGSVRRAVLIASDGCYLHIREGLRRFRLSLKARIYEVCPEKEASVLCDLLLGDKEGIDEETETLYQNSGIAHILSISGLHISILGMGCFGLLRKLKCREVPSAMISAGILVLYGTMTGMSVSASRAIGMFVIRMFSHLFGRTDDPPTSLGIIAALTALTHPALVTGAGFLLSYGAALGILAFLPAVRRICISFKRRYPSYPGMPKEKRILSVCEQALHVTAKAIVSSLSIILFTLPVQLWFFFRVPVYAVFLNLLILPCMSLLVFSGMLMLIPGLGVIGSISCLLLDIFEELCRLSERLPFHSWSPGRPGALPVVIYYLGILIIILMGNSSETARVIRHITGPAFNSMSQRTFSRDRSLVSSLPEPAGDRIPCLVICTLTLAGMLYVLGFPHLTHDTATQLYVGQGNCNVMITDAGEVYMFDGGSTSRRNVGEYIILPFLRYNGITCIDAIFISHSDEDHMNGCLELLENMNHWDIDIGGVYITPQQMNDGTGNTSRLIALCSEKNVKLECISAGDKWYSGDTFFTCLHPGSDFVPEDANSGSMCILAVFPADDRGTSSIASGSGPIPMEYAVSHTILLPGDVQGAGERALTEAFADNRSLFTSGTDVYITSHHGSSGSSSAQFLEAVRPQLAINSAGLDNRYGHPHEETLARLDDAGCAYLNTFETGAVTLYMSGEDIRVRTYLPLSPDPESTNNE